MLSFVKQNDLLVFRHSAIPSLLIAVNDGARGGTRSTIEYAFKRGVNVLDIPLD